MLPLLTGLASLAVEVGPAAIRGISHLFGGSDTAEKVASAVEKADSVLGLSKEAKQVAVTRELQNLPPETQVELEKLKGELEKEITRRQELTLADKQAEQHETQETIRAGDTAADEYVRHTRPMMARRSFWMMVCYVIGMEGLKAFGYGSGADWQLAMTLGAPCGAYLGLRTIDGFAPYSKSSGDKVTGAIANLVKGKK